MSPHSKFLILIINSLGGGWSLLKSSESLVTNKKIEIGLEKISSSFI